MHAAYVVSEAVEVEPVADVGMVAFTHVSPVPHVIPPFAHVFT